MNETWDNTALFFGEKYEDEVGCPGESIGSPNRKLSELFTEEG